MDTVVLSPLWFRSALKMSMMEQVLDVPSQEVITNRGRCVCHSDGFRSHCQGQ